ncbi:MAG: hypothetical protein IJ565_02335 [Bacilli bacterium]|nr:hypothetical protein [Bacilli bacterium]
MNKVKYIVILLPLVLTGCFGLSGSGNLKNTCIKKEETNYSKEIDTYTLEYYQGDINKITLVKEYSGIDMKSALETYQKAYATEKGVNVQVSGNTITYIFDISKVSDEVKTTFNLKDTYSEQSKTLQSLGFTCD